MAALANLPEDVMIEILSMLPAEALLRFKSVCKFWYALINDPKFIRKHLSNSTQHEHVLLKRRAEKENIFTIFKNPFSMDRYVSFSDVCLPLHENFLLHFIICGHSHGLLCLSNGDMTIFLCNPTTREFRQLPPSILPSDEDGEDYFDFDSIGFGYDSKSKDFKVVRIVNFDGHGLPHSRRVEVYDLSKDRWREIESFVCSCHITWPPYFHMYHDGIYYWVKSYDFDSKMILTFDMSEEVFDRISIPGEVEMHHNNNGISLGILNGSIVLINYGVHTLDIWEMYKNNESRGFSWSKLLTINDTVFEIEKPLLFVSADELLIEVDDGIDYFEELFMVYNEKRVINEEPVILYNIKDQHFKPLSMIKGDSLMFEAIFFVKSLISVKGGTNGF